MILPALPKELKLSIANSSRADASAANSIGTGAKSGVTSGSSGGMSWLPWALGGVAVFFVVTTIWKPK